MIRTTLPALVALVMLLVACPAAADPIQVKYTEGVTRGFPVLRSLSGEKLAQGELAQIPRGGDVVENRLASHLMGCWTAGRSSLRRPLH